MNGIITGASRGLGSALALKLGAMANSRLILTSRDEKSLKTLKNSIYGDLKPEIIIIPADLSVSEGINTLLDTVRRHFDTIDILVNNAGMLIRNSFEKVGPGEIIDLFRVNYLAPSLLISAMMPLLLKSERAHVLNIGSMGGVQGSKKFPGLSHYSASKAALSVLTECLAEEYKHTSVRFNCLALGAAQTDMLSEAFPGYKAPLSAEEMAEFIAMFALEGSKFFNGKILPVSLSSP